MADAAITEAIVKEFMQALIKHIRLDVAIVGGGPSGLVCAYYLGQGGVKTALFEKKLAPGGGLWGGGFGFPVMVLPQDIGDMLRELGIAYKREGEFLLADTVAAGGSLIQKAAQHARIFNGFCCEDLIIRNGVVCGVVFSASSSVAAGLHIDPISFEAKIVVDATGHDAVLAHLASKHLKKDFVCGQGPMNATEGEDFVVERTGRLVEGLYLCGMSVNAVYGGARMGPIFGGMLKSGRKCAELILEELRK